MLWRRGVALTVTVLALSVIGAPSAMATETIAVTGTAVSGTEGTTLSTQVASFVDSVADDTASGYGVSINWGDGTPVTTQATTPSSTVSGGSGSFTVGGTHTYAKDGTFQLTIVITDAAGSASGSANATATISEPPLYPVAGVTTFAFTGQGGNNTSVTPGSANAAESAFEAGIGGANNGAAAGEHAGGFRSVNWDGVALDGTAFGGTSKAISSGNVATVPVNGWQPRGLDLESAVAITSTSNSFSSVNANAAGLFPAFSPTQDWAPFNVHHAAYDVVTPSAMSSTPVGQATLGLGVTFLNVRPGAPTTIEYFFGSHSLGKITAPSGAAGQASFAGMLFSKPVVTRVEITLGNALIFSFDGTNHTPGATENPPTTNMVAADDVVLAEPAPIATTTFSASGGSPFDGVVASFGDGSTGTTPSDFSATIDWGDGSQSLGTVAAASGGGFTVSGVHTYAAGGTFPATVEVRDDGLSALTLDSTAVVSAPPTPDTTPPDTALTAGPTGPTKDTTPTFTFSSEVGASFACAVDTSGFAPCVSPFTAPGLADGPHTFSVRASDPSGNVDATPATAGFTIDTKPPSVSGLKVTPKRVHKKGKLRLHLSEDAALVLRFDRLVGKKAHAVATSAAAGKAGTSTLAFSTHIGKKTLAPGAYRIVVTPTDAAGNRGAARSVRFSVGR